MRPQRRLPLLAVAIALILPQCSRKNEGSESVTNAQSTPSKPVSIRYLLPVSNAQRSIPFNRERWRCSPTDGEFSNPNGIVYDQSYIDEYADLMVNHQSAIYCGVGEVEIVTNAGVVRVQVEASDLRIGTKLRVEDLMQFLQQRIKGSTHQREFTISHPDALKTLTKRPGLIINLDISPWERDLGAVMLLLSGARYEPSIPLLRALRNDSSDVIRRCASLALRDFDEHDELHDRSNSQSQ